MSQISRVSPTIYRNNLALLKILKISGIFKKEEI